MSAARIRREELVDILYSGTSTSRQKQIRSGPAPDMAKVPLIDERTANALHRIRDSVSEYDAAAVQMQSGWVVRCRDRSTFHQFNPAFTVPKKWP
ncbi:hypothetical protein ACTZWT_01130 [Rhodopseudomonas sp. NSM]|uniref:hypothetical protein n=1 Tax=Rhodopseudomonas sp. NSM TaxID=3457630 RepID=UPI0040375A85